MPMIFYDPNVGEDRGRLPNATNPYVIGGIRFMPGINQPSEQEWRSLNEHPTYSRAIATRIEIGKLRVMSGPKKDAEPSITDYNLSDAKEMIAQCHDVDLLKRWQSEDSRRGAQNAIADQLKKLSVPEETTTASKPQDLDLDTPVFA